MKRFVVVGIGRSGTKYMSALLTAAGVECGWERFFKEFKHTPNWSVPPYGDSSWFAAPFLDSLPDGTVVLHQTRNPLGWLNSWCKVSPRWSLPFANFVDNHCGFFRWKEGSHPTVDMKLWVAWNEMIAKTVNNPKLVYHRYSVESVDLQKLRELFGLIGAPFDQIRASEALAATPKNVNHSGDRPGFVPYRWADLPAGAELDALKSMAQQYGYGVGDG